MTENARDVRLCELCGNAMPAGEEVFRYHGRTGPCPSVTDAVTLASARANARLLYSWEFSGYQCRIVETQPGMIQFQQRGPDSSDGEVWLKTEHPMGIGNEILQLAARAESLEAQADARAAGEEKPDFLRCETCGATEESLPFRHHLKSSCPGPVRPARWVKETK